MIKLSRQNWFQCNDVIKIPIYRYFLTNISLYLLFWSYWYIIGFFYHKVKNPQLTILWSLSETNWILWVIMFWYCHKCCNLYYCHWWFFNFDHIYLQYYLWDQNFLFQLKHYKEITHFSCYCLSHRLSLCKKLQLVGPYLHQQATIKLIF